VRLFPHNFGLPLHVHRRNKILFTCATFQINRKSSWHSPPLCALWRENKEVEINKSMKNSSVGDLYRSTALFQHPVAEALETRIPFGIRGPGLGVTLQWLLN